MPLVLNFCLRLSFVQQCIHTCPLCSSVFTPVLCAAVYSHLSIVQQCIHPCLFCSSVFTPVHCAAVYSHLSIVQQCIHTCPLCSSVFTPVCCAAVYSHLSIVQQCIHTCPFLQVPLLVVATTTAMCSSFLVSLCQQFAVCLNEDVVIGVWFVRV